MKKLLLLLLLSYSSVLFAQTNLSTALTIENIMRDPKWIGTSPSAPYWSRDGKTLFFSWNPNNSMEDSIYYITTLNFTPVKADYNLRKQLLPAGNYTYNNDRTLYTFTKNGDVFYGNVKTGKEFKVTETVDAESNPEFILNSTKIAFRRNQDVFAWEITTGLTTQLSNFKRGVPPPKEPRKDSLNQQEKWLLRDQLEYFEVLRTRKNKKDSSEAAVKALPKEKEMKGIYYGDKILSSVGVSPNGRFITYRLTTPVKGAKNTIVPNYVTETGFTQDINTRTKVGAPENTSEFYVYDNISDTIFLVKIDSIHGIKDLPDYAKDYSTYDSIKKKPEARKVTIIGPSWSPNGTLAVVEIYSSDNKDRWIMQLNAANGKLKLLNRQRDEAWIGGPGSSRFSNSDNRWVNEETYWYQSEESGYAHLYTINVQTGEKKQLTSGKYEVQKAQLSVDKKLFYITTNEVHPGEKHFYKLPVTGGKPQQITTLEGANDVIVSPDDKNLAILYSYSTKPWELYLQENKAGAKMQQLTFKAQSPEFKSYPWRDPEVITFTAADGAKVYGRLYKPANPQTVKPAVVFVHGAGYLQNAHKWWSSYFREYMFHNLLVEQGYTVLDIDYRGSAGYGRDWRTGIYRFMGGKDLSDHVDGAKYLVDKYGIDPKRIGIYGGSYGGFITLMAMFTKPGVFASGAALRSVTDWAHYNDGYTSNILNEPFTDSIAYKKSSPIYYAEGLQGNLLMAHGMLDVNVHFQDIVRLSQRLIELKKDNWELAVYPMEDHGFVEPSSWTDEYKRILKLFENTLKHK